MSTTAKKQEKPQDETAQAVLDVVSDIQDLLQKSGYGDMQKNYEEEQGGEYSDEQAAGSDEFAEAGMEGEGGEEMGDEAAMEEGGEMEEGEGDEDLASYLAQMSDEELQAMLEALMSEMDNRGGGEEGGDEAAMEEGGEAAAMEGGEEDLGLAKSMKSMMQAVEKLSKSVSDIGSEVKDLKKSQTQKPKKRVGTKALAGNNYEVLEKSKNKSQQSQEPQVERLSKSETIDFLHGKIRQRDPVVAEQGTSLIWEVNRAQSDEELHQIQDRLVKQGVQFPKL